MSNTCPCCGAATTVLDSIAEQMTLHEAAKKIIASDWGHENLLNMIVAACKHFRNQANRQADVRDFMTKFGQYRQDKPGWPPEDVMDLRVKLIAEEFAELLESAGYYYEISIGSDRDAQMVYENGDGCDGPSFAKTIDAIIDLQYVLEGMLETCGVQGQPIWDEVHAANMRKEGGATRSDGKICKPAGWVGPDIERVLREQGWVAK